MAPSESKEAGFFNVVPAGDVAADLAGVNRNHDPRKWRVMVDPGPRVPGLTCQLVLTAQSGEDAMEQTKALWCRSFPGDKVPALVLTVSEVLQWEPFMRVR